MSLTTLGSEPQPSLAWTFESSNVDYVTNLSPSSTVQPGPAQLVGSAALVTNAPTSNTAVSFPGTAGAYMNLGTLSGTNFNHSTSNLFLETWVYCTNTSVANPFYRRLQALVNGADDYTFSIGSGKLNTYFRFSTTSIFITSVATVPQNAWTHLAISFVPGTSTAYIFVNGSLEASASGVGTIQYNNTNPTVIGNSVTTYFNGYIRDLRVVQGGVVPTSTFTPGAAPFSYVSPTYVANMGTTVFTLLGQFITYVPGKYNQGLMAINNSPTTTDKYIQYITNTPIYESNGFTISCWVNILQLPVSGQRMSFVNLYNGTGYGQGVWLGYDRYGGGQKFAIWYENTGMGFTSSFYGITASTGTWYHICGTIGGSFANVYVNGIKGTTGTYTTTGTSYSTVYVGCHTTGIPPGFYEGLSGTIDDLRIYNTALTAAQVQSIYTMGGAPASSFRSVPQATLAWDFNGTTADYITGLTGTVTGSPTYVPGKYIQGIRLNNTPSGTNNNYVTYPISLNSIGAGFSIFFWYSLQTQGSQTFVSLNVPGLGDLNFYSDSGGYNQFYFYNANSPPLGVGYPGVPGPAALNTMYHVGITYANGVITIYGSGILGSVLNANNGTTGYLYLSKTASDCTIDDLRIYNTALSSAQVQSIYAAQGMPSRGVATNARGVLDALPAAAAFSLRKLSTTYTGPVVQIERQNDLRSNNFVADFAGNLSNIQNGTTLQTFLSGTSGNLLTWYDQSGNERHATIWYGTSRSKIVQTSNLGLSWAISAPPGPAYNFATSSPLLFSGTNFTVCSSSRRITNISIGNNSLWCLGASSVWSSIPNDQRCTLVVAGSNGTTATWLQQTNATQLNSSSIVPSSYSTSTEPIMFLTAISAGGTQTLYSNNNIVGTVSRPNLAIDVSSSLNNHLLGAPYYGNFGGETSEIIFFTSSLSPDQISQVYRSESRPSIQPSGTIITTSGTPLFTQLSPAAVSSAVGAFSLRAVNGTTAKAVQVRAQAQFPPTAMTSAATVSGGGLVFTQNLGTGGFGTGQYVTRCSRYDYGWTPIGAFDLVNGGLIWQVNSSYTTGSYTGATTTSGYGGEWIQLQTPSLVKITSYYVAPLWTSDFVLLGSVDAASWTLIDTQTGLIEGQTKTITGLNPSYYSYYRFVITKSYTNVSYPGFNNIILYGSNAAWNTDFYADRLGNLLTAPVTGQSLANWLGGATGYVATWYDQSGQGNHATQATAANQPIIQKATKGAGYSCLFSGNQRLAVGSNAFLNNTPYTLQIVERRAVNSNIDGAFYLTWGGNESFPTSNSAHIGYRKYSGGYPGSETTISTNQAYDDKAYQNISIKFSTAATENVAYTFHTHDLSHAARIYTWRGGSVYPSPFSTNVGTFANFLRPVSTSSYFIGANYQQYQGEIYEMLFFSQSLYDLDNTGGLITRIYNNQVSYTGV